jgi:hypothetical protein
MAAGELRPVRVGRRVLFARVSLEAFARRNHRTKSLTGSSDGGAVVPPRGGAQ